MTYRSAYSLGILLGEVNEKAPNRSKISDGWIGDAAHASRDSDHNPWVIKDGVGIVRARDFTHDPSGGLDCNWLASKLASLLGRHPALGYGAYVIWNHRIISTARLSEGWRDYNGSNAHTKHVHVSVTTDYDGFDSRAPWLEEEDDMTPQEVKKIAEEVARKAVAEDREKILEVVDRRIHAAAPEIRVHNPYSKSAADISLERFVDEMILRTGNLP